MFRVKILANAIECVERVLIEGLVYIKIISDVNL